MKKLLLIAAAVLMLASCGGNTEQPAEKEKIGDRGFNEKNFETNDQTAQKATILSEEEADFGNFKWGMSQEDVVNVHGGGYTRTDNSGANSFTIRYNRIRIEGFASDAEYTFTDGKLSQAIYFIKPDSAYKDKTQYITEYKQLVQKYTDRFGKPSTDEIQFAEGKETDDIEEQAKLLVDGMLLFRTIWTTDTTEIRVNIGKDNGDIVIGVRNIPIE